MGGPLWDGIAVILPSLLTWSLLLTSLSYQAGSRKGLYLPLVVGSQQRGALGKLRTIQRPNGGWKMWVLLQAQAHLAHGCRRNLYCTEKGRTVFLSFFVFIPFHVMLSCSAHICFYAWPIVWGKKQVLCWERKTSHGETCVFFPQGVYT